MAQSLTVRSPQRIRCEGACPWTPDPVRSNAVNCRFHDVRRRHPRDLGADIHEVCARTSTRYGHGNRAGWARSRQRAGRAIRERLENRLELRIGQVTGLRYIAIAATD